MKKLFAVVLPLLVLVACDDKGPTAPGVNSIDAFVQGLQQQGATVVRAETFPRSSYAFFQAQGVRLVVNGENVTAFEYDSAGAAQQDASRVSPDGSNVGTTMITWIDVPRFYKSDRLIALYVGRNQAVIGPVEAVLGAPFAGGNR